MKTASSYELRAAGKQTLEVSQHEIRGSKFKKVRK